MSHYLAGALLHRRESLRLLPKETLGLVVYAGKRCRYWLPFPGVVALPLVALFGVGVSDAPSTVALRALAAALIARLLTLRDRTEHGPLSAERHVMPVAGLRLGPRQSLCRRWGRPASSAGFSVRALPAAASCDPLATLPLVDESPELGDPALRADCGAHAPVPVRTSTP